MLITSDLALIMHALKMELEMGLIKAFTGALGGTLADQWKDIIQPAAFDEFTVVSPGVQRSKNNGRGTNYKGSEGVITNGSMIYVPENTAAYIFSQQGIEDIVTEPGGFEYQDGMTGVFSGDGFKESIVNQTVDRFKSGGITTENKRIAYVNMREIRNIKFGTRGAQVYNDLYYGVDLEVMAFGVYSIQIIDATKFICNFVPPGVYSYSFIEPNVKSQLLSEFLQSFTVALNKLSDSYRISKIQSHNNELTTAIINDTANVGTWPNRFGFKLVSVGLENVQMSEESKMLVRMYAQRKMDISAYEDVSKRASDFAAQQKIAEGIQNHGLGDGGGMIFGMNAAQAISPNGSLEKAESSTKDSIMTIDEQIETVKKMKNLLDEGILSQDEFERKKKEIMGL